MKLKLTPNKKLFLMFLAINAAGYDYENNPEGEHKVRQEFRKRAQELLETNSDFAKLVETIKSSKMPSNDYIRLVNSVVLPQASNSDVIIKNHFKKVLISKEVDKLFNEYKTTIKETNGYKVTNFNREFNKVLDFFNLDRTNNLNIDVHLNLLESYNRGTNYYTNKNQIILTSLDLKGNVNWQTVRHEFMHILLKMIFKDNLKKSKIKLPVNKNYSKDALRVKFEENFILSANLYFLDKQKHRDSNLKYFYDNGYKKIYSFYEIIDELFIQKKLILNENNLRKLLSKI